MRTGERRLHIAVQALPVRDARSQPAAQVVDELPVLGEDCAAELVLELLSRPVDPPALEPKCDDLDRRSRPRGRGANGEADEHPGARRSAHDL